MDPERTVADVGEFPLIARFQRRFKPTGVGVVRGVGDDTAVLEIPPNRLLLATTDSAVEGVHFRRTTISPRNLGRRVLAVNLSDIAAMGGEPRWALVSLGLPPDLSVGFIDELADGLAFEAERFGATIVGGNLARSPDRIIIDVTMMGDVEKERVLYRRGAHPGDRILVTGTLGDSAAGLSSLNGLIDLPPLVAEFLVERHWIPIPRVEAGRAIALADAATSMIDLSDGLASDLGHITKESGVGAEVDASLVPLSEPLRAAARITGRDPLEWALRGGEDYELLLTVPPSRVSTVVSAVKSVGVVLTDVGQITPGNDNLLIRPDGSRAPLWDSLWHHFASETPS